MVVQHMVVFNENDVTGTEIDKHTSMIAKLSTQHRPTKLFKARVCQGKGWPLTNSRRSDQYITTVEGDSTIEAGHIIRAEIIIGTIQTLDVMALF